MAKNTYKRRPEIYVDERGRTSLAKVRSGNYARYVVESLPNGTLVLTPVIPVAADELAELRAQAAAGQPAA